MAEVVNYVPLESTSGEEAGRIPSNFKLEPKGSIMKIQVKRSCSGADKGLAVSEEMRAAIDTGWPSSPTLRFKDLLKLLCVSRSKAYELMKTDPDFPRGIPVYDSEQSPGNPPRF